MLTKSIFSIAMASLLVSPFAHADDPPRQHAGFQVYKIVTRDSAIGIEDASLISVSPANVSSTVRQHRYQVMSNGQIGDVSGLDWKKPKAQSYMILPAKTDVRYDTGAPGQLNVTSASGVVLQFRNGLLSGITDENGGSPCDITFNRNAGLSEPDFKIDRCDDRIVFDTGIGTTNGAYADIEDRKPPQPPPAMTRVSDPSGRSCRVPNFTLFEPLRGRNTKADVKLKSQAQIYQALRRAPACAGLDFSSLSPSSAPRASRLGPNFLDGIGTK